MLPVAVLIFMLWLARPAEVGKHKTSKSETRKPETTRPKIIWDPNKSHVFNGSDRSQRERNLRHYLPAQNSRAVDWNAGWIPTYCYTDAKVHGLEPDDFRSRKIFSSTTTAPRPGSSAAIKELVVMRAGRILWM